MLLNLVPSLVKFSLVDLRSQICEKFTDRGTDGLAIRRRGRQTDRQTYDGQQVIRKAHFNIRCKWVKNNKRQTFLVTFFNPHPPLKKIMNKLQTIIKNNSKHTTLAYLPFSHVAPVHPPSHPLAHWPVTWLQVTPSLQCPEHWSPQLSPYHPSVHSMLYR